PSRMLTTSESIVSGEAPGYSARTLTIGMSTSGSSRISTASTAAMPASRMSRLSTSTSTGRRMETLGRSLICPAGTSSSTESSKPAFSSSLSSGLAIPRLVGSDRRGRRGTAVEGAIDERRAVEDYLDALAHALDAFDHDQVAFLELRGVDEDFAALPLH